MNLRPLFLLLSLALGLGTLTAAPLTESMEFTLKPDPAAETLSRRITVDVNLGATPEAFVALLWKQLTGETAPDRWVRRQARLLGTKKALRRIDLAQRLAAEANVRPVWRHSDPWVEQIPLRGAPSKSVKRDIGAVFMFFFSSPGRPNGGPGWANNHVPGMFQRVPNLSFPGEDPEAPAAGYYHPHNPGFWFQELRDAHYAGIDFLLLNVYGPDLDEAHLGALQKALTRLRQEDGDAVIKLAMFDDTWTWGQPYFGDFWTVKPDCRDTETTAQLLYTAKWKPYFEALPREHWYLFKGQPFIYFYNNNTLQNRDQFAAVLARMKALFKADFGVEPFVAVDSAFDHSKGIEDIADSSFKWDTFNTSAGYHREKRRGVTLAHSITRWDSVSRSNNFNQRIATPNDRLVKDDSRLIKVLNKTRDDDLLVLATWNDLGEGTGLNRSYDYYWDDAWKAPNHFMKLIRRSQAGETLK